MEQISVKNLLRKHYTVLHIVKHTVGMEVFVDVGVESGRTIEDDVEGKGDFKITIPGTSKEGNEIKSVKSINHKDTNALNERRSSDSTHSREQYSNNEEEETGSLGNKDSCTFFEASSGCRYGDKCRFQHYRATVDAGDDAVVETTNPVLGTSTIKISESELVVKKNTDGKDDKIDIVKTQTKNKRCRYYVNRGKCKYGEDCKYLHENNNNVTLKNTSHTNGDSSSSNTASESTQKSTETEKNHKTNESDTKPDPSTDNPDKQVATSDSNHESVSSQKPEKRVCRYFNSNIGCRNGSLCPNIHRDKEKKDLRKPDNGDNEKESKSSNDKLNIETTNKEEKELVPSSNTKRLVCRFYNSKRGCYKGAHCPNIHENQEKQNLESPKQQICKFFLSSKGCIKDDKCPNFHQADKRSLPPKITDLGELRKRELAQLEKRFAAGNCSLDVKQPNTVYYINVSPTDPDWPFLIKKFELAIDFPEDYPKQLFTVTLQDNEQFPPLFANYMNQKLEKWSEERKVYRDETSLDFRPFLKWFDKNLIDLFRECATMVKLQLQAQQAGITLIHHDQILPKQQNDGCKTDVSDIGKSKDISEDDNNTDVTINNNDSNNTGLPNGGAMMLGEDANEMFTTNDASVKTSCEKKVKKGTEVKFPNLYLSDNVATMRIISALLQVECNRCRARNDYSIRQYQDTKHVAKGSCKKCNDGHSVTYHSELIHQHSPIVGYLHMEGCKAFDFILNDSTVGLVCLECDKEGRFKGMTAGSKKDHWCRYCNVKIEIHVKTVKFNILTSTGVSSNKHHENQEKKKKVPKEPGIREGQSLPNDGACAHYKKSFRWLRFPCCGKAYPCDICHDEKEDHEMQFAKKMICGVCSKEQPFFKDKPCISCKGNLTKSHSSHWEGGKGCRDRSKMARTDKQKTAGEGKTISRKKANEQDKKKKCKKLYWKLDKVKRKEKNGKES